ncbi:MAG: hypothetical protein ACXVLT_06590 [Flavisolibacter sp.]
MEKILILLFILLSLIPVFYINRWFQNLIIPRKSMARLFLYFLVILELVFIYTYLLVTVIVNLFPLSNR